MHTHPQTYTRRDKVIAITALLYHVVGVVIIIFV